MSDEPGTIVYQKTHKNMLKHKKALASSIVKYNEYCDVIQEYASDFPSVAIHRKIPEEIGKLQYEKDKDWDEKYLDLSTWVGSTTLSHPPVWASDPTVRGGIRIQQKRDRGVEEIKRLQLEVNNMLRWYNYHYTVLDIAARCRHNCRMSLKVLFGAILTIIFADPGLAVLIELQVSSFSLLRHDLVNPYAPDNIWVSYQEDCRTIASVVTGTSDNKSYTFINTMIPTSGDDEILAMYAGLTWNNTDMSPIPHDNANDDADADEDDDASEDEGGSTEVEEDHEDIEESSVRHNFEEFSST